MARLSYKRIWSFRIPWLSYRAKRRPSLEVSLKPDSGRDHGGRHINTESKFPRLAIEIVENIADCLFTTEPLVHDCFGDTPLYRNKPDWGDVQGFMLASVELHRMGFIRWLHKITIRLPRDWSVIYPHLHHIREIRCLDNTLLDSRGQKMLSEIPFLKAASIDAHSDIWHDDNNRFAYRDIVAALPPSTRRLEVVRAHGPDIKVIASVKEHCPRLEVLRLGRCTMFNCIPACDFWSSFPHDHDAYISDTGIDTYAHSLGQELSSLKNLRSLRMGLYLVPSDIVLAHRLYHRHGRDAPHTINWQTAIPLSELADNPFIEGLGAVDPATTESLISVLHQTDAEPGDQFRCLQCAEATTESTWRAEKNASAILHKHVPSLVNVEWMGWLTPGHLGVHSLKLPLTDAG